MPFHIEDYLDDGSAFYRHIIEAAAEYAGLHQDGTEESKDDLQYFKRIFEAGGLEVDETDFNGIRTQLHNAADNNCLRIAEFLLRKNANAGLKAEKGYTALHLAALKGHDSMVELILKLSCRQRVKKLMDMKANDGSTALHLAAKGNRYEVTRLLLSYGANFEVKDKKGKMPIEVTTLEKVRKLLGSAGEMSRAAILAKHDSLDAYELRWKILPFFEYKATSLARNRQGYTPLQVAVDSKHMPTVKVILEKRMQRLNTGFAMPGKVEALGEQLKMMWNGVFKYHMGELKENEELSGKEALKEGFHALCYVWMGLAGFEKYRDELDEPIDEPNVKIIEEVLEVIGLDPEKFQPGNRHEEDFVTSSKGTRLYELLLSKNANDRKFFVDLLEFAIWEPMKLLIKSINGTNLLTALKQGDIAAVKKCTNDSRFVDFNIRDTDNRRPLQLAVAKGNLQMVELLLKKKADMLIATEENGETPLHLAVKAGHLDIVKSLLFHCDVDKVNDYVNVKLEPTGETALHLAAKKERLDMIWCLMEYHAIYCLKDKRGKVPKDYAKTAEIKQLFEFIEEAFDSAKNGVIGIVEKFKDLEQGLLLAAGNVCDKEGHSVPQVATLNKHRDIGSQIFGMVVEAKKKKDTELHHE